MAGARRALVSTVPVLGLAGVVTAAVGSTAQTTPEAAGTALVTTPIPTPTSVALNQPDLGIGPDVTTVAADASKAAGQAGERQREQERQSIDALVDDVRGDARARDIAAGQQSQDQITAFQKDAEQIRKADEKRKADADKADDRRSCSWGGIPQMGGSTDGNEIVGRDCGLLDVFGTQRSSDPWIDGQLLDARGDS
ncbi:hypothetical protein [Pseudonocardia endophytica]|uniref:hypothetical protein n=1 Tax=Pseudonocardia endophytica TaxID=401976 RepID=UPI00104B3993|nr:hypothetical protein [Pseudonocardia endophytica]